YVRLQLLYASFQLRMNLTFAAYEHLHQAGRSIEAALETDQPPYERKTLLREFIEIAYLVGDRRNAEWAAQFALEKANIFQEHGADPRLWRAEMLSSLARTYTFDPVQMDASGEVSFEMDGDDDYTFDEDNYDELDNDPDSVLETDEGGEDLETFPWSTEEIGRKMIAFKGEVVRLL